MPPVASKLMSWQLFSVISWWRHQMETFSAFLAICAGNSPVPGEFPAQRPVTRSFDVSFDLRLNKRLSKQSWGWWFETLSRPLWRHRNNVANALGWVALWGFLWWEPSAKRKDHHGASSGWSSTWFHSNAGLSSTQYEQIPIIFGVWPFWLTPFFFRSITLLRVYG